MITRGVGTALRERRRHRRARGSGAPSTSIHWAAGSDTLPPVYTHTHLHTASVSALPPSLSLSASLSLPLSPQISLRLPLSPSLPLSLSLSPSFSSLAPSLSLSLPLSLSRPPFSLAHVHPQNGDPLPIPPPSPSTILRDRRRHHRPTESECVDGLPARKDHHPGRAVHDLPHDGNCFGGCVRHPANDAAATIGWLQQRRSGRRSAGKEEGRVIVALGVCVCVCVPVCVRVSVCVCARACALAERIGHTANTGTHRRLHALYLCSSAPCCGGHTPPTACLALSFARRPHQTLHHPHARGTAPTGAKPVRGVELYELHRH